MASRSSSSSLSSSSLEFSIAKPYTGRSVDDLRQHIHSLWQNFVLLPNYDEEKEWNVYLLYKSFFGHYSMLFLLPGHIEGFLVHLLVEDKKTNFYLNYVNLGAFRIKNKDLKALSLGTTEPLTAAHIITRAHDILVSMGPYNAVFNNCQDYCKEIANDIGVSSRFSNWKDVVFAEVFAGSSVLRTVRSGVNASVASTAHVNDDVSTEDLSHVGPHDDSCLTMTVNDLFVMYEIDSKKDK